MTNLKDKFIDCRDKLLEQLVIDNKVVFKKDSFHLKTTSDFVVKKYNCSWLVDQCLSKTFGELKFCMFNKDNPFNHVCPVCSKKCIFTGVFYSKTCRNKKCLCELLFRNHSISHMHDFIRDTYLIGNRDFNPIEIGYIEKHHVYSGSQLPGWHSNIVKTWKNKTSKDLLERKQKTISTCRMKYGCDFSQQNIEVKKKQSNTWHSKSKEELEHKNLTRKQTTFERYGVDHIMKSKKILNDVRQRHLVENRYFHWNQKNIEHKDVYFDDFKFKQFVISEFKKNNYERIKKPYLDKLFNVNVLSRCKELKLMKFIEVFTSELEEKLKKLFTENGIKYEWRNRSIVDGPNGKSHCYELDFFLPNFKIAIEINDLSTHNSLVKNNNLHGKNYHLYKTDVCKSKGIRLIHIWEWEIKNDFNKLASWLLNELDDSKRKIDADACIVKIVDAVEAEYFFKKYSIQTCDILFDHCFGLLEAGNLIQLMVFSMKEKEIEIIDVCTKFGISPNSGAKKLFKHLVSENYGKKIKASCDYSKQTGEIYEKIGMKFLEKTSVVPIYCDFEMNIIDETTWKNKIADKKKYLPVHNCGSLIYEFNT